MNDDECFCYICSPRRIANLDDRPPVITVVVRFRSRGEPTKRQNPTSDCSPERARAPAPHTAPRRAAPRGGGARPARVARHGRPGATARPLASSPRARPVERTFFFRSLVAVAVGVVARRRPNRRSFVRPRRPSDAPHPPIPPRRRRRPHAARLRLQAAMLRPISRGFKRHRRKSRYDVAATPADETKSEVRLLPVRPRSRVDRRSLRTFHVVTLHPRFPFNV